MQTKYIIMRPGQPDEERYADLSHPPAYGELRALIQPLLDGGDLEHVSVYMGDKPFLGKAAYRDMFVDETGHHKFLARNEAATILYLRNMRMHDPDAPYNIYEPAYFIVGTAVLFPERKVWQ